MSKAEKSSKKKKQKYDCMNCPAYCCSYAHIPVTDEDLTRIADHFDMEEGHAIDEFMDYGDEDNPRILAHKEDEHFETICIFLDDETRGCGIYASRPAICRNFPSQKRCGYYEFLQFERDVQDDEEWVATTS